MVTILRRVKTIAALFVGAARNAIADLRMGALFGGEFLRRKGRPEAGSVGNSDHSALRQIFERGGRPDDVLVDVGCGGGRAIAVWMRMFPEQKAVGIELNAQLAARARARFRSAHHVSIITGDAPANLPADGTLFYLFNPMDREGIARLEARLRPMALADGRIRILYHNPKHVDVFTNSDGWVVDIADLEGPFGSTLHPLATIRPVNIPAAR